VEAAQKMMSILWFSLLIAMAGYTILSFFANVRTTPNAIVLRAMSIVAAAEVIALFVLRRKMLVPAMALLSSQSEDAAALARWKTGHIVTWALSLSVALYGLVLRYLGFAFTQVAPFFIAGFILMLFYFPRRPVQTR
jgi:hypothetical protein